MKSGGVVHEESNHVGAQSGAVSRAAAAACSMFAPMWGLDNFVAVNPFWGLRDTSIAHTDKRMKAIFGAGVYPEVDQLRAINSQNPLADHNLLQAAREVVRICGDISPEKAARAARRLLDGACADEQAAGLDAYATFVGRRMGRGLGARMVDEAGRFAALYFDRGQAVWRYPLRDASLFEAWRHFATTDRSLEIWGLAKARRFFSELPSNPEALLEQYARILGGEAEHLREMFAAELAALKGWAAYAQHQVFEDTKVQKSNDLVQQLLAVMCAYALLAHARFGDEVTCRAWRQSFATQHGRPLSESTIGQAVIQQAFDNRFVTTLEAKLAAEAAASASVRPELQAVFCIDVRSEGFRRALEAQSPAIRTAGFAGFFGLFAKVHPRAGHSPIAQYPVLLNAGFEVCEKAPRGEASLEALFFGATRRVKALVKTVRQSVSSGFSFVEAFGAWYAIGMLRRAVLPPVATSPATVAAPTKLDIKLTLEQKIAAARAMLKNMSLTTPLAPLVLLVGHSSQTDNNPYASGLDCGACGGHSGESNARIAATILNDSAVRSALEADGRAIPSDTRFVPAVHNTTLDSVTIVAETDGALVDAPLMVVEGWLKEAGARARRERCQHLGAEAMRHSAEEAVGRRANDWSEVRPEWGLARNAAFIAARRCRTRDVTLSNRVFLHEYDAERDTDCSILELIMTAPMVVANWINLQYLASTAAPSVFGSGTKVLHNVTGQLGVVLGNGGDLQLGLPFQSVHTGSESFHEPLRLNVIIEAEARNIQAIVAKHTLVQQLVGNGWLHLYSLDRTRPTLTRVVVEPPAVV